MGLRMRAQVRAAFGTEMDRAVLHYHDNELDTAFSHLERAHVLGQSFVLPHTRTHWWMLKVGIRRRDGREVFAQVVRIIGSAILSRIWVPLGNTGAQTYRQCERWRSRRISRRFSTARSSEGRRRALDGSEHDMRP